MHSPRSALLFQPMRASLLAVAWLALAAPVAQAAGLKLPGTAIAAPAASPKSTAPEPVPAGDIAAAADADERFAQDVIARARQKALGGKLDQQLDTITTGIVELSKTFENVDLKSLPAIRLESLQKHWRFYKRELDDWRGDLERASAPFNEDAAQLAQRHGAWDATRAALATGGVTSALTDRVDTILEQIRTAEEALAIPLEASFKLHRRANTVQSGIEAGLKGVDAAIAYYDRRLAMVDAQPVWQAWNEADFTARELRGTAAGLGLEAKFIEEWSAANHSRMSGYKVAAAVLLPLLLWLSYRSRRIVATEPEMQAAARVLRRPLSAWLLLVLMGILFAFPDAPLALHQIALFLALIPVLRLLPQKVYDTLGAWPYVGTALYLLYRVSFLLLGQPALYRLYLLAITVVTASVLAWLLYSARRRRAGRDPAETAHWLPWIAGWIGVLALLVSAVANVVGNVSLAEMLSGAVLDSAYVGLALYAGASVLSSIMKLLLARRVMTRFRVITQHTGPLLASLDRLIVLAAVVVWVVVTMNQFRIARPVFGWVKAVLSHPLEVGQISITLGSILLFLFAVYVAFWVASTVRLVLRDEVLPKMDLPRGVGNSISSLSYYALVLIGLMVALAAAGFETSQFALVFGALGVGIGLGLQNVVNNFVSGLILMFERPIQPGDVVEVSGTSGKVREIGMRATTLTTFEGADVVVPNGTLLSEKFVNWTLSDMTRRIDVEIGVAYGSDARRVLELLREVAQDTPGIVAEPVPAIVFKGFGASSLDFGVRAWTHDFGDWVAIRTELTVRVYEALSREGIQIPFPQHDLHLRSVDLEAGRRLGAAGAVAARHAGDAVDPRAPG